MSSLIIAERGRKILARGCPRSLEQKSREFFLCTLWEKEFKNVFYLNNSTRIFEEAILAQLRRYTGLSKKMDGIWNRYNLKSTGRIYTFGVLKCSEKFEVLDLP